MSSSADVLTPDSAPKVNPLAVLGLAWLIPGGGHFLLKRPVRGAVLCASTVLIFVLGLTMRGAMFEPQHADLLTTVIYTGGWLANVCTGLLYLLAKAFGYNAPDVAGAVVDYGSKFLVAAGLFNILAMVDAYEIATGKKD
jgi:hypothetical protein